MINLYNSQKKYKIIPIKLKRIAKHILELFKCHKDLNIIIIDNKTIKKLNRQYLNHDYITDVISFTFDKKNNGLSINEKLIGEIYVSAEKAFNEAKKRKIEFDKELARYVIHGILHVFSYNDYRKKDFDKMWKKQEKILNCFF